MVKDIVEVLATLLKRRLYLVRELGDENEKHSRRLAQEVVRSFLIRFSGRASSVGVLSFNVTKGVCDGALFGVH